MGRNYWLDNHTLEGAAKLLVKYVKDATNGSLYAEEEAINYIVIEFFDLNPDLVKFQNRLQLKYIVWEEKDMGGFFYTDIKISTTSLV